MSAEKMLLPWSFTAMTCATASLPSPFSLTSLIVNSAVFPFMEERSSVPSKPKLLRSAFSNPVPVSPTSESSTITLPVPS